MSTGRQSKSSRKLEMSQTHSGKERMGGEKERKVESQLLNEIQGDVHRNDDTSSLESGEAPGEHLRSGDRHGPEENFSGEREVKPVGSMKRHQVAVNCIAKAWRACHTRRRETAVSYIARAWRACHARNLSCHHSTMRSEQNRAAVIIAGAWRRRVTVRMMRPPSVFSARVGMWAVAILAMQITYWVLDESGHVNRNNTYHMKDGSNIMISDRPKNKSTIRLRSDRAIVRRIAREIRRQRKRQRKEERCMELKSRLGDKDRARYSPTSDLLIEQGIEPHPGPAPSRNPKCPKCNRKR